MSNEKVSNNDYCYNIYKIRIYPNDYQKEIIENNLKACEFVYNYTIHMFMANIKKNGGGHTYSAIPKLNVIKKDIELFRKSDNEIYSVLNSKGVNKHVLDNAAKNAIQACSSRVNAILKYVNDIATGKHKNEPDNHKSVKFKDASNPIRSYHIDSDIRYLKDGSKLRLSTIGATRITEYTHIPYDRSVYKSGRIIKDIDGKYYVSIKCYERNIYKNDNKSTGVIVIDVSSGIYLNTLITNIENRKKIYIHEAAINKDGYQLFTNTYRNDACNKSLYHIEERIKDLSDVLKKNRELNIQNGMFIEEGGMSNGCKRIENRLNKLIVKKDNIIKSYISNYVASLMKKPPAIIIIQSTDAIKKMKTKNRYDKENNVSSSDSLLHLNPVYLEYSYFYKKLLIAAHKSGNTTIKVVDTDINNLVYNMTHVKLKPETSIDFAARMRCLTLLKCDGHKAKNNIILT